MRLKSEAVQERRISLDQRIEPSRAAMQTPSPMAFKSEPAQSEGSCESPGCEALCGSDIEHATPPTSFQAMSEHKPGAAPAFEGSATDGDRAPHPEPTRACPRLSSVISEVNGGCLPTNDWR